MFDGASYNPELDGVRLRGQLGAVFTCMRGGGWRTIPEIKTYVPEASEQGISARLRDLRKPKFGGYLVEKRRRGDGGLWEYRLLLTRGTQATAPERLTQKDMEACLWVLRQVHKHVPHTHQAPIAKLGKWLATNTE